MIDSDDSKNITLSLRELELISCLLLNFKGRKCEEVSSSIKKLYLFRRYKVGDSDNTYLKIPLKNEFITNVDFKNIDDFLLECEDIF